MAMGSWLRMHKKQIIAHTSIIVVFVLLTIFVIEPAFETLERIPGEAQLYELQLPAVTNDIIFNVDEITVHSHTIFCRGWGFIEGYDVDLERSRTYIVLKSDRHTYIFDTAPRERPAVTTRFEEHDLNLDWAGFVTNIPVGKMAGGRYTVGLYITRGDIQALQYTSRTIVI